MVCYHRLHSAPGMKRDTRILPIAVGAFKAGPSFTRTGSCADFSQRRSPTPHFWGMRKIRLCLIILSALEANLEIKLHAIVGKRSTTVYAEGGLNTLLKCKGSKSVNKTL